jgi:hypothetical protein
LARLSQSAVRASRAGGRRSIGHSNFATWVFPLLRNFVLAGVLKYFYDITGSEVLLPADSAWLIFVYCLTYADQWYLNLFGFLKNKRESAIGSTSL